MHPKINVFFSFSRFVCDLLITDNLTVSTPVFAWEFFEKKTERMQDVKYAKKNCTLLAYCKWHIKIAQQKTNTNTLTHSGKWNCFEEQKHRLVWNCQMSCPCPPNECRAVVSFSFWIYHVIRPIQTTKWPIIVAQSDKRNKFWLFMGFSAHRLQVSWD